MVRIFIATTFVVATTSTASFALDVPTDPGPQSFNEGIVEGLSNGQVGPFNRGYRMGFGQGFNQGMNEGFLEGYGAGSGFTPGPIEVPFGSTGFESFGFGGGGGGGGGMHGLSVSESPFDNFAD